MSCLKSVSLSQSLCNNIHMYMRTARVCTTSTTSIWTHLTTKQSYSESATRTTPHTPKYWKSIAQNWIWNTYWSTQVLAVHCSKLYLEHLPLPTLTNIGSQCPKLNLEHPTASHTHKHWYPSTKTISKPPESNDTCMSSKPTELLFRKKKKSFHGYLPVKLNYTIICI